MDDEAEYREKTARRIDEALQTLQQIKAKLEKKRTAGLWFWYGIHDPEFMNIPNPEDDPANLN